MLNKLEAAAPVHLKFAQFWLLILLLVGESDLVECYQAVGVIVSRRLLTSIDDVGIFGPEGTEVASSQTSLDLLDLRRVVLIAALFQHLEAWHWCHLSGFLLTLISLFHALVMQVVL